MLLPEVAENFQRAGITVLIYDPRSIGLSDGTPRNEIDPIKQVEDYSEALTFIGTLSMVDPDRIAFWGMSFAGTVALCAAALDKRAKLVIAVCPLIKFYIEEKLPRVLAKAMKDRQSQAKGNGAFYLPPFARNGDNPIGMADGGGLEAYNFMVNVKEKGAANFENRTTLQSYYKIVQWQPRGLMHLIHQTPVLMLIPELDQISKPEDQRSLFNSFSGPKELHIAHAKGHLNVLSGEDFPALQKLQVDFIRDLLVKH